ncbi:hypothetical protein V6N13_001650 [Hibiscus sabdariffa]|uniref:Uncharacterized protein n=1 Tax=Hibiscus sabdariffa TaxID=183260 RepID=A0ABR2G945_9ROSI
MLREHLMNALMRLMLIKGLLNEKVHGDQGEQATQPPLHSSSAVIAPSLAAGEGDVVDGFPGNSIAISDVGHSRVLLRDLPLESEHAHEENGTSSVVEKEDAGILLPSDAGDTSTME